MMKLLLIFTFLSTLSFASFDCQGMKLDDVAKELLKRQIDGYAFTDASSCMGQNDFKYIQPDYSFNSESMPNNAISIDPKSLNISSVKSMKDGAYYEINFSIKGKDGKLFNNEKMNFIINKGDHGCVSILSQPKNFVNMACIE